MKYSKVIADPHFGWIRLTREEAAFIDACPFIQRLRYIKQLGFAYMVYPAARHTRFEHALGVMHVVTFMFQRLIENDSVRRKFEEFSREINLDGLKGLLEHLRFAALIHDLGHYPYSHVLEEPLARNLGELARRYLPKEADTAFLTRIWPKLHELTTFLIIVRNDVFRHYVSEYMSHIDPRIVNALLHADLISAIEALESLSERQELRERLGLNGLSDLAKSKAIGVLKGLLSGDFDADRVEYLLRDSYVSGANVGYQISLDDIERILLNAYIAEVNGKFEIVFDEKAKQHLEGFTMTRFNIYKYLYLHHKVIMYNSMAKALFEEILRCIDEMPEEIVDYLRVLTEFALGASDEESLMMITDDYLMSLLTRLRPWVRRNKPWLLKLLDPLILRKTSFKALWKRDVDFIEALSKAGHADCLRQINERLVELMPYAHNDIIEEFYKRLKEELKGIGIKCLSELADRVKEAFLIGHRSFSIGIDVLISCGDRAYRLCEISPIARSIYEAWSKSPHIFVYVDMEELRRACGEIDVIDELRKAVIKALAKTGLKLSKGSPHS